MARSRDISKVLSSSTALATDSEIAATYQTQAGTGLKKIIPTSIAVGSGTGSASALGTVTFSGCSSLSINGVFSSTYDSYRVVFDSIVGSANVLLRLRWRKSGTDNSSSIYYSSIHFTTWTGVSNPGSSQAASSSAAVLSLPTTNGTLSMDVVTPLSRPMVTGLTSAAGPEDRGCYFNAYINGTDTFDGFTVFPASGTITGSFSIYGYTK